MPYLVRKGIRSFKRFKGSPSTVVVRSKTRKYASVTSPGPAFTAKVKKVMNKNEEPRHLYTSAQLSVPASGGWYTCSLTTNMTQGDTNTSRQGDEIHLDAVKLAMRFSNLGHTGIVYANVWYRVIVGRFRNLEINTGNAFSASNAGVTQGITYANNSSYTGIDGIVDPRFVTVLYDHKVHIMPNYQNSSSEPQIVTKFVDTTIKLNYDLKYRTGSTEYANTSFKNLYMVVIPYNENGAIDVGIASVVADLIWKEK